MDRILQLINDSVIAYANWIWGTPLLILLMGGGLYFVIYSRFIPFRYFFHAINILRGKYDHDDEEGEISHYEALSTALAATVGMGNVSGVAVAITMGGPGAIFWMWMSAIVGMVTKYFTITLAVLFRGKDDLGNPQGGPMYVIEEGMGKKWKPLGIFFSLTVMVGALPIFQANQLTRVIRDVVLIPNGMDQGVTSNWIIGISLMVIVSLVIFGGIKRIANVAGKLVPVMVVVYFVSVLYIILVNISIVPESFALIFSDAFTGNAVLGGAVGSIIIIGAKRAAFSNEAGIGTAPMVQGQAKTSEPVREGLVGMLGPAIDTLVVCTLTALAILITGTWTEAGVDGVTVTVHAFDKAIPGFGGYILFIAVLIFAITSLFSYSYYGEKSLAYLIGTQKARKYRIVYVLTILLGALASLTFIINVIDAFYAMMAIPTMISAIWLSPKVMEETKKYFAKMKEQGIL
jgi:alanine or glycine:cation symporter, AGCS family